MLRRRRYINRILPLRHFLNKGETIFDNAKLDYYYKDDYLQIRYEAYQPENVECIKDYNMEEFSLKGLISNSNDKLRYYKKKRR